MEFSRSLQIRPSPLANSPLAARDISPAVSPRFPPLETLRGRETLPRHVPSGGERGDTAVFAGQFSRSFSLNFASNDIFREHLGPISYPCGVSEVWLRPDPGDDLQKGLYRLKDAKNRHAGIWVIFSIRCGASLVCFK